MQRCRQKRRRSPLRDHARYPPPQIPGDSGSCTLKFSSNYDWTATVARGSEWLSLDSEQGEASYEARLTLRYKRNTTGSPRTASVTLSNGYSRTDIELSQTPYTWLESDVPSLQFDSRGASDKPSFVIAAIRSRWTAGVVTEQASWLAVSPASGEAGERIEFTVTADPNPDGTPREATVRITAENASCDVTVFQSGSDVTIDRPQLDFKAGGGTEEFTLTAHTPCIVRYDRVPWLNVTGIEDGTTLPASSERVVSVAAQANFLAPREAAITIVPQQGDPVQVVIRQSNEPFVEGRRDFPCIWEFADAQAEGHKATFLDKNYLKTSNGSAATLSFVRLDANERTQPHGRTIGSTGHPLVYTGLRDDYWLFTIPVSELPARSAVDVTFLFASVPAAGRYHSLEYFDGGEWKSAYETRTVPEAPTYTYTHMTPGTTSSSRKVSATIVFEQPFHNENMHIRLRQSADIDASGKTINPKIKSNYGFYDATDIGAYIRLLDGPVPERSEKILFVGNSYTFYNLAPCIFKEIAWSEGHHARVEMALHSAYTMAKHMALPASMAVVELGGYDYAVLQDQSLQLAIYGTDKDKDILSKMRKMIETVKRDSPSVTPLIEMTWGRRDGYDHPDYNYDFMKTYEAMQQKIIQSGIEEAKAAEAWCSPVGVAWQQVRTERPDIELYASDGSHPSYAGSYLAACVLYLTVYGEPFGDAPADCLLDAPTAAYLRSVAQSTVIGNDDRYNIHR